MNEVKSSNRRIVRNTLMLYLRMLLSVVVGLYTSRVVLQILGVEDYGIYSLVGGIVSILGFLNTSLAGATSRFITFELGAGDQVRLQNTFNAAFQSHLIIAFFIVLFAETLGLWFVNNKLNIPQERYFAAQCIYQFSIISMVISITQVPYTAVVLAHEQMDVYAWLEIISVVSKLLIVWLLQLVSSDKLIVYAILALVVTILIRFIYRFYCLRYYPESHLKFIWNKDILRQLFSFTTWNLYADASVTIRQQGINILVNRFFGVALNASCSLASMIQGYAWLLGYNVLAAFRPQIIKQYAAANYIKMQQFMDQSLRFTLILLCLFTIPAIVEMPFILRFWLGEVPTYTVTFCRILLIDNLLGLVSYTINLGVYAQGNIKVLSIVSGTLKFLCLPIIFLLFSYSFSPSWAYLCNFICLFIIVIADFVILNIQVPQIKASIFLKSLSRIILTLVFCTLLYLCLRCFAQETLFFKSLAVIAFILSLSVTAYFFLLNANEQKGLRNYIVEKL